MEFDEWIKRQTKTFEVKLDDTMTFTFKQNPTIGDYERVMNYEKNGSMMVALLHGLLMKPVISKQTFRQIDGKHLNVLLNEVMDHVKLPEAIKNNETIRQRDFSNVHSNTNQGTKPTNQ
jgi:hypothetical protein